LISASPQGEEPEERPLHEVALLAQPAARPVRPPGWPAVAAQGGFTGLAPMADGGELRDLAAWDGDLFAAPAPLRTLQPPDVRLNRAPTAAGMQSALVTGDKAVHTDRDARVRVQFHWQRGAQGSHRLPLPEGGACNAPGTAASSTWVRVGQSHGGFNHGALFLPRVGQEVLVGFIAGDVERPVVLGSLYNGRGRPDAPGNQVTWGCGAAVASTPPWFAGTARSGEHEGHAHPAVLTGHRSVSLDAGAGGYGGWSQFVFDDSAGAGRIELSTSQAATRLQLGALQQQERNQRLAPRGLGLGLDTEAQAALRAGAGLLLSAHAQASSTDNGQQMDVRAPLDVLRQGQERLRALAESAQAHGAQLPGEAGKPLPAARGLQALADSLAATQSNANGAAADGGFGTVAAWQRPELVLAAPAGVGLFTPAEAVFSAGTNAAFVAGQDVNVVAQGDHVLAARCGVVLYTFGKAASAGKPNAETGIAIHAAAGSVHASANTGAVRMAASQAVEVASTQGSVEVGSALSVLLAAAGAALKLEKGGIKVIAPGAVTVHAGLKEFTGPAIASGAGVHLPVPPEIHLNPQGPFSVRFAMQGADDLAADAALCGLPYRVCTLDGTVVAQGAIGKDGRIPRIETEFSEPVLLEIGEIDVASMTQLPVTKVHDAPDDASHVDANEESDASTFDEKYRPDEHREPKSKYEDALATAADRQYGIFLSEDVITTLIPLEQDSVSDAIRSIEE
jgi:type VI secretion system secreted protein VgrG